jgi:triacylglycerol lipase
MAALRIRLIAAGWPADHVMAITFRDPTGSNTVHAGEIGQAVDSLMARTGDPRIDIVAHSMGGLATREYLKSPSASGRVRRVVLLATPNEGTYSAYLAFGEGREDMIPGSSFLDSLNAGPPVPNGVEAVTIRTPVDLHILPAESATLRGVPDVTVCCPTHLGLLRDMEVFRVIRRFLADGVAADKDDR